MEKTTATLIRKTRLTDTSLIVHWCCHDHGIIKTVARGSLRPNSPFAGKLDLFYEAEIEVVRSRKSDLHILKELRLLNLRTGIRKNYARMLAASYFTALIQGCVEVETPIGSIYDLLRRALDFLDAQSPTLKAVIHFEKSLAGELGVLQDSVSAIECIRRVYHQFPPTRNELMTILNETTK